MKFKNNGWFLFLVILALIALDQIIFNLIFKISYFTWYLNNGALIGAIFTLITLTWDINKNTGLVSANPRHYVGSIQQLLGVQIYAFGALGKRSQRKYRDGLKPVLLLDDLVFMVFALLLVLANVLWLTMVVPFQYFFILFLGGPARLYLSSPVKVVARFEENRLKYQEIPKDTETPKEWMDLSVANKPVTMTYALVTLALVVTRYFL
jgi:hypothetical protein